MRRRQFITLLGGAAVWPATVRAQQSAMPLVGFLDNGRPNPVLVATFCDGLAKAGYVEGQNVAVEYRWANTQERQLPELAADLIGRQAKVIVASGSAVTAYVVKRATSTIPIVLAGGIDPVTFGLVASLNRPGGNITGVTFISIELSGKRFGLLCEVVPQTSTVAYLSGGSRIWTFEDESSNIQAAAATLGRQVVVLEARDRSEIEPAFETLVQRGAGALIVGGAPHLFYDSEKILAQATLRKIPAIYPHRGWVGRGGLMSYGANALVLLRQVGSDYVGRILKGAKPADLPE